ncbi:MAG: hypothetical protein A2297_04075 [Elusimicrobia bacterium RIFOXYB2_FULL_48_7]|nr:MAG: hypothetical protein A2297_04075 [Elusimicrobia bacterium RIFOXYB2_FULL_48_7]
MAKIMVVDDSRFMRLTLKNMLENNGHQVVGEAENEAEAVVKYTALKPDIVTMDIIMPVESGITAVKKIIALDPAAKIIMVSAMGQEKILEDAKQAGAKGFVVKPVKQAELAEAIKKIL